MRRGLISGALSRSAEEAEEKEGQRVTDIRGIICGFIAVCVLGTAGCRCCLPRSGVTSTRTSAVLSDADVMPVLERLNMPGARVLEIRPSPVAGFWEVGVENGGRRFVIYLDSSRKYVTPGPFIEYANRRDITRERAEELDRDRRIDVGMLSLDRALVVGEAGAPVRVIVFTDPGCPYCARLHQEIKKLVGRRPDMVFFLKLFTVRSTDPRRAKSIICGESLSMLEDAYEHKEVPYKDCPATELDDNTVFAKANGIVAAPTVILPDGTRQVGFSEADALEKSIDRAESRRSAGRGPGQPK